MDSDSSDEWVSQIQSKNETSLLNPRIVQFKNTIKPTVNKTNKMKQSDSEILQGGDDKESDEDDGQKMPDYLQKMVESQNLQGVQGVSKNDMLLFDPCEDEINEKWVLKETNGQFQQVSCSRCF